MEMLAKERCVLFVSPGPSLLNPASGEGTRLKHLSQGLAEHGWDVIALVPKDSGDAPTWIRETYHYEQWSLPFLMDLNPWFMDTLAHVLRKEAVDVVHLSNGVCTAAALSRVVSSNTAVTYAAQNVEADHARDFVNPDLPAYKRLLGPRLIPWIERVTLACADLVTTVSEKDRDSFVDQYGLNPAYVQAIPTGTQSVDRADLETRRDIRDRLGLDPDVPVAVFHGSYAHPPNEEAIELLVDEIVPELESQGVDVQFLLVGKGIPAVDRENVIVAGFVDDLFSVLNAADFAVVPIRHGGGTKTKMYDYISLGLPIVTTSKGAEGIDLESGVHAIVTEDADERFVGAVEDLSDSPSLRTQLQEDLKVLSEILSWSRSVEKLAEFYRR